MGEQRDNQVEISDMKKKEVRKRYSTGFLEIAKNESIPLMIDALLDAPTGREFNKAELARKAGISPGSVRNNLDVLLDLGIINSVPDTNPTRFSLNMEGPVTRLLFELDNVIGEIRAGEEFEQFSENPVDWEELGDDSGETGHSDESQQSGELQQVGNPAEENPP